MKNPKINISVINLLKLPVFKNTIPPKLKDAPFLTKGICKGYTEGFDRGEGDYGHYQIFWDDLKKVVNSDFIQYSPFKFENGIKVGDNWNNDSQNLLIFDIDEDYTILEAIKLFAPLKYLIATTKSHGKLKNGKKQDRFRIIFYSNNIPKGRDYFLFCRELEYYFPFLDKQVNVPNGAFLSAQDCQIFENDGRSFDCQEFYNLAMQRKKLTEFEEIEKSKKRSKYLESLPPVDFELDVKEIKSRLSVDIIHAILDSIGIPPPKTYKANFSIRREDKKPSASICHKTLNIKDFGGGEWSGDIIKLVEETKGFSFPEALELVAKFV